MRYFQRLILLLLLLVSLLVVPFLIRHYHKAYFVERQIRADIEYFFHELCRDGTITLQEYDVFCMQLRLNGNYDQIEIREYQKKLGLNGRVYRDEVLWEEVKEALQENGIYQFAKESEVRLQVGEFLLYGELQDGGER